MSLSKGGATIAVALLAIIYPDRPAFTGFRSGIVYRAGYPIFGHLFDLLKNKSKIHDFELNFFQEIGSLTGSMPSLGLPFSISTIDPQNIEYILKTNFSNYVKGPHFGYATEHLLGHGIFNADGEQWRWQRKVASHIFNVKNFRDQFTDVFVEKIDVMCEAIFDKSIEEGRPIDFHDSMFRFTLDSFILLGFGVELKALTTQGDVPFAVSFDKSQQYSFDRFTNPFIGITNILHSIFKPWEKSIQQHVQTIDDFARNVISQRREELARGQTSNDLLSRFMGAKNENGESLNETELRDIVLNFIIAGRDTTAQALSWTFYNLSLHPRVEEKLLREVNEKIGDEKEHDAQKLYEIVKTMTYAHAVFHETLRLYPSVPENQKYALEDDIWPDGTPICKGDYIGWSPYAQARSTAVWGPDASSFNPERWITPEGELRRESQGQWPVFHGGPRVCLGQNLATLEALIAIAFLIKRYKLSLLSGQDITYQTSLTLPMKNGMLVRARKRY
ncbi:cytochrome P450 [Phycomyces nitens]|nr:cytochrome P450 [Phycomyces nitens]